MAASERCSDTAAAARETRQVALDAVVRLLVAGLPAVTLSKLAKLFDCIVGAVYLHGGAEVAGQLCARLISIRRALSERLLV